LPKEHRLFTVCAECGRQAHDCWAMGSMVNFNSPLDQPSYVACVYCSTYRALVAFMDTDVKWFDALQLQVSLVKPNILLPWGNTFCWMCWIGCLCNITGHAQRFDRLGRYLDSMAIAFNLLLLQWSACICLMLWWVKFMAVLHRA